MRRIVWIVAALIVLGLPIIGAAQSESGRITGVVTDATGGVLPGVTVNARGPAAMLKTTVTDSAGKYSFESLAPGAWTVTFELAGFATGTSTVTVVAGQAATAEIKLALGARTEAVQVTGTLIPRPTLEAMSPVTTLEVEELTYRGISRVEDLLTSLPQVFVAQNSSVSNGATGVATVDLRYLGPQRTLVLIDGRRMPQGDAFSNGADLNFIPSALVKRVDVLTGGASSTYGADAVSGVVNFVLDRDFTGFRGGVEYSGFQHNNNNALAESLNAAKGFSIIRGSRWNDGPINFNVAWGSKFADNRGHASFYLDYRKTNAITKDQRDYTNCSVGTVSSDTAECGGSSTSPTGRFFANDGSSYTVNPTTGQMVPWSSSYVYNYAPRNFMQRPDTRWAGGAFINFDMNKHIQLYGDVMFMDDTTDAQIAESGDFGNNTLIDCRNPLLNASAVEALCTSQGYSASLDPSNTTYLANVQIYRRNIEGGPRIDHLNHTDLRYTAGIRGTINNAWSYDVYGMQATVRSPEAYENDLNTDHLIKSLLVQPYNGVATCTNMIPLVPPTADNPGIPNPLADGCVPYNVWAPGGVTRAQLDYLSLKLVRDSGLRTRVFNATLKGDLKDYGVISPYATEAVKLAFGGEYRQEYLFVHGDTPYEAFEGSGQGGPVPSVDGTYSVKEFFVEGLIPLVQDKPFAKDFSLELGFRESSYSSTGSHATYKLQMSWAPTPDFKTRVGYNRATRSPNISELYTPQFLNLGGTMDPCDGTEPVYSAEQCARTGLPTNLYGTLVPSTAGQYNTLQGGTATLRPEVANTWTAGLVLTPRKFLPGFTATIDYYHITINQTIGFYQSDDIMVACATQNVLCNLIHRDPQYHSTWRSPQGYVVTLFDNVGQLKSEGIDITGSYTRPVPHDLGAFSVNLVGTYLLKSYTDTGLFQYDCVGLFGNSCGVPSPKWRHMMRFAWETPWKFTLNAGWRFIGPSSEQSGSTNPALADSVRWADLQAIGNMADRLPAFNWLDLAVTWKLHKNVTLIAGVNNVFDKEPPMGIGSSPNDYGAGFFGTYDALGRYIHTGLQFTF